MAHQVVWFDIPVSDLDRAMQFYSTVLGTPVRKQEFSGMAIGILPSGDGEVGGCLYQKDGELPSSQGPLLYLNVQGRLDQAIGAVEPSGGKVLQPKHAIGPYGFRAIVLDSEGNRLLARALKCSHPTPLYLCKARTWKVR